MNPHSTNAEKNLLGDISRPPRLRRFRSASRPRATRFAHHYTAVHSLTCGLVRSHAGETEGTRQASVSQRLPHAAPHARRHIHS